MLPTILGYPPIMEEPVDNPTPRRYRWPKIVGIALILWVVLSVIWVRIAVRHVEEDHDFNAPIPSGPAH